MKKCQVKGCTRDMLVIKHKLCTVHATRFYRTGSVGSAKIAVRRKHKALILKMLEV